MSAEPIALVSVKSVIAQLPGPWQPRDLAFANDTVLRVAVGTQQGVVISASALGKLKTVIQVAMVLALITVHEARPLWVSLVVYVTVAVTILSGADYFFGLRRGLAQASASRAPGVS